MKSLEAVLDKNVRNVKYQWEKWYNVVGGYDGDEHNLGQSVNVVEPAAHDIAK